MHWSEDGRSIFLTEERKFPGLLLSHLSAISYASPTDGSTTTTDSTGLRARFIVSVLYAASLAPFTPCEAGNIPICLAHQQTSTTG
jgi:hypothetical protein